MRLSILPFALSLCLTATAQQKPLQVYLHPTPSASGPDSPPTLSADQAKAVLAHHLGEPIGDFDEIPSDEGLWSHLIGMWDRESVLGEKEKARVVILEGGVLPQGELKFRGELKVDVLPTTLSSAPSFYLEEETSTRALLAPYLQRASHFLENILHSIPGLPDRLKDLFSFAESSMFQASHRESRLTYRSSSGFREGIIRSICNGRLYPLAGSFKTRLSLGSHLNLQSEPPWTE